MSAYELRVADLRGVPALAVRVGRALENWGARAARPLDAEELRRLHAEQLEVDAALAARVWGVTGAYRLMG